MMHIIMLFYSSRVPSCQKVVDILDELVKRRDDVAVIAVDIETDAGIKHARELHVGGVPEMIVDGEEKFKGFPKLEEISKCLN